jgi:hypothetical protein
VLSLSKQARWACLLALPSCSQQAEAPPLGEPIECALDGATKFVEVCRLERDGPRFSLHRPDGGFRRFEPVEGQGVRSIDGADAALVRALADGRTEISVAGDRYRVRVAAPAQVPEKSP